MVTVAFTTLMGVDYVRARPARHCNGYNGPAVYLGPWKRRQ